MIAPDLPRWIDHPRVDSQAMLNAFSAWIGTAPKKQQQEAKQLFTIDHAFVTTGTEVRPRLPTGVDLQSFQCKTANCERCASLRGGYQFKWYDARLAVAYNSMKRDAEVSLPMPFSSPGGGSGLKNDIQGKKSTDNENIQSRQSTDNENTAMWSLSGICRRPGACQEESLRRR